MLINLSNHPYSKWDSAQRNAAAYYGEVVDMVFPMIDAEASEEDIEQLSEAYIKKIVPLANKDSNLAVHIMGEMTFTYTIVNKLIQKGITCLASTTVRNVIEDADGHQIHTFRFVRFRRYVKN